MALYKDHNKKTPLVLGEIDHGQSGYAAFVLDRIERGMFLPQAMNRTSRMLKRMSDTERSTFAQYTKRTPPPLQGKLQVFQAPLGLANLYVDEHHRHHKSVVGHLFSLGVMDNVCVRGYAIIGRPVARGLDDGETLEVTRVVTDGSRNACSKLYGAARRHAKHLNCNKGMSYKRMITYTLHQHESGSSLLAAGFRKDAITQGGSWNGPLRIRVDKHPLGKKVRWICQL